jgi:hypothetical protein
MLKWPENRRVFKRKDREEPKGRAKQRVLSGKQNFKLLSEKCEKSARKRGNALTEGNEVNEDGWAQSGGVPRGGTGEFLIGVGRVIAFTFVCLKRAIGFLGRMEREVRRAVSS